jgi:hypothetical protein
MSRVHVGARIFEPRLDELGRDHNGLKTIRAEYLATGTDGPTARTDQYQSPRTE